MAEELSEVASILTGTPAAEAEKPETDSQDPVQEIEPSAPGGEAGILSQTDSDAPEKPQTMTVKALAEKLEMRPQDLYGALEIDVGGQTISLSELKDRGKDLFSAETKLAQAEEHTLTSENDLLRKNRELTLAVQRLGREPSDTEKAEAQQLHQAYVQQENAASLKAIPDWADAATQTAEVGLISEVLIEYGFSPVEISNVLDHRQIKMLRDYALLRQRLKAAGDSEVKSVKKVSGGSQRKSAPAKKDVVSMVRKGELSQTAGVIAAIADGAKRR